MAITFVGSTTGVGTGASYTVSLNGTLTGGSNTSPSPGDVVVVFTAFGHTASVAPGVSGNNNGSYTGVTASHQYGNDTWDTNFQGMYKRQGSTVDTTLTITRQNTTTYGGATVVMVWRGVDPTTPIDVTPTTATQNNAGTCIFNCPSIQPTTAGAVIIAAGAGTMPTTSNNYTAIGTMSNFRTIKGDGSTSDTGVAAASFDWTSGAYDPVAVSGGTVNASGSWVGLSMALRPEPPPSFDITGNSTRTNHTSTTGSVTSEHGLTGNSARQDTTSSTGAVTSQHTLTGSNTATPHTSTTGATAQAFTITGNSVAQGNTSTTGAVSSEHGLTGSPVAQSNTSTNGSVESSYSSPYGAFSSLAFDDQAFNVGYLTTAGRVNQSNTSTTGAISQTVSLSGNSVASSNTSTTGAVSQTHLITGASVQQNITSTTGNIGQANTLTGNSVAQPNTTNTGAVDQTHTLTGNSALQETTTTDGAVGTLGGIYLTGDSVVQSNTCTTGATQTVLQLTGNSIIVGHLATVGGVATAHNLMGDWVESGWVESDWVYWSSVQQNNVSTDGDVDLPVISISAVSIVTAATRVNFADASRVDVVVYSGARATKNIAARR
jgi:hypothetical protein